MHTEKERLDALASVVQWLVAHIVCPSCHGDCRSTSGSYIRVADLFWAEQGCAEEERNLDWAWAEPGRTPYGPGLLTSCQDAHRRSNHNFWKGKTSGHKRNFPTWCSKDILCSSAVRSLVQDMGLSAAPGSAPESLILISVNVQRGAALHDWLF